MKIIVSKAGFLTILVATGWSLAAQQEMPLIEDLKITPSTIAVTPEKKFKSNYLKEDTLTVIYNEPSLDLTLLPYSIITIPFISCVIPIIWVSQERYSIPEMDYDYWHALNKIKEVFKIFYPELSWSGELIPDRLVKNQSPTQIGDNQTALLFSGGLDSTASSFFLSDKKQLLITLHGYDVPLKAERMWESVVHQTKLFGKTYGHDTTEIIFNFFAILKHNKLTNLPCPRIRHWLAWTTEGLCHTGAAAPILFAKGYRELYMAASFAPDYILPYGTHPLIDNNIKFSGIQVHHHLMIERCQKMRIISDVATKKKQPLPFLRVCWGKSQEGFNCKKCSKCVRTMNETVVEGFMPQDFGFDITLPELKKRTQWYIKKKSPMHYDDTWEWANCQRRARARIIKNDSMSKQVRDYLTWYVSLDLDKLTAKDTQASDEYRQFYQDLVLNQGA